MSFVHGKATKRHRSDNNAQPQGQLDQKTPKGLWPSTWREQTHAWLDMLNPHRENKDQDTKQGYLIV